ncbi:MAG: Ig-like domain-containing protein, partial [Treponemataceae bacterium]|nr:Ig-like domain-containing protein [Treponemataceae bacterium]
MKTKWIVACMTATMILLAVGCDNGMTEAMAAAVIAGQKDVAVESVTLDHWMLTIEVGMTEKLTATVEPQNAAGKTVTWSSSDTSVAAVDENGTVRAVGTGSATITAQAGDKTATCRVYVQTHTHYYDGETCTKCGLAKPVMDGGTINAYGVLTDYTGNETDVKIPDGVTGIGKSAFRECTSLTSVTIPDGVTSIGWDAFYGCTNLDTVNYDGTLAQWCALDGV